MYILHPSEHRCHDQRCEVKETCQRWLQRNTTERGVIHASILRPAWQVFSEPCPKAIIEDTGNAGN